MFELESDRQRWLTAFNPLAVEAEGKQQRRQVIALHRNDPQRPDELSLEIGDVLVVFDQHDGKQFMFLVGQFKGTLYIYRPTLTLLNLPTCTFPKRTNRTVHGEALTRSV